ncbi:MAG: 2-oxoglutarate dehydrogenase complex dihydrolipoyllysine-residue succinyltransferase [Myxococcota bacterium]
MSVELTVPQLGESITEAVVGKWHKQVGEEVTADEPLVVLETDKVTIDLPAPAAGALERIAHQEGDRVKVGELLGTIAENGHVVRRQAPREEEARVTPVAKKLAEEKGVDVSQVKGTGPGGRVLKEDVLAYGKEELPFRVAREERVPMTPLRKRVAERLLAAQANAAILTTFNEADMSAVLGLRKEYGERFLAKHGVKLGLMSFFVKACIAALKVFPQLNAEIDGDDVVFKRYYDIGVAVAGSRGLVVPVVRDADQLSFAELERRIAELGQKARTDKLTLEDLKGGTFTLTNGGIFGSMLSTPILNPPQTGILGMHNIVERPVAREGQVVIRPVMYLALSYDHRLVDGREAVLFLVRVKEAIEDPKRLLLEI